MLAYQNVTSIYWLLSVIRDGSKDYQETLDGTEFVFQALADQDPNSTLSLQFKCHFEVKP